MDAGAIEPRNTGIFPAAWLESSLEETAVMGGGRGRLGEGGNRSAGAAKRSKKAPPPSAEALAEVEADFDDAAAAARVER